MIMANAITVNIAIWLISYSVSITITIFEKAREFLPVPAIGDSKHADIIGLGATSEDFVVVLFRCLLHFGIL